MLRSDNFQAPTALSLYELNSRHGGPHGQCGRVGEKKSVLMPKLEPRFLDRPTRRLLVKSDSYCATSVGVGYGKCRRKRDEYVYCVVLLPVKRMLYTIVVVVSCINV
jgi:hypothetical protein